MLAARVESASRCTVFEAQRESISWTRTCASGCRTEEAAAAAAVAVTQAAAVS
jgi:hypothetical protein